MNKHIAWSKPSHFSGFIPSHIERLGLPTILEHEARLLLDRILAAESVKIMLDAQTSAQGVALQHYLTGTLTANQAQDLGTLFKAASFERADQLDGIA